MELPKQSMIEFFSDIKKEQYALLLIDLQKIITMNNWVPQLINRPWHYVEHVIPGGALAVCFAPDNILLSANAHTINWFDYQKENTVLSMPYDTYHGLGNVCFDKGGEHVAVMSKEDGYTVNLSSMEPVRSIDVDAISLHVTRVNGVCVNHDDSMLVVICNNADMHFYDMETGKYQKTGFYDRTRGSMQGFCCSSLELRCAVLNDMDEIIIGDDACKGRINMHKQCVIPQQSDATVLCFNRDGTYLAVGSSQGKISVFDATTGALLWTLFFNNWIRSLSFDGLGTRMAIGSHCYDKEPRTRIIAHYDDYTIDQLLLRKLMHLWLQVKKPASHICSMKALFNDMARLFRLYKKELVAIWASFPFLVKQAIKETMLARIERYKHHETNRLKKAKARIKKAVL